MYFKIILTVFAFSASVQAQVASSGTCPTVIDEEGFDIYEFLGLWHLYASYDNTFINGDCVSIVYTENDNRTTHIDVTKTVDGVVESVVGNFVIDEDRSGKVYGDLNGVPINATVTKTDYTGYGIIYVCDQTSATEKEEIVFVYTREVPAPESSLVAINEYIASSGYINPDNFIYSGYDNC